MLNSKKYCSFMSCHMTIYLKFKILLTAYGLTNGSLKLGNEHFFAQSCDGT